MGNGKVGGYVIAIQNWYALPAGGDAGWASITSLDETASVGGEGAKLIKQTYQILEVPEHADAFNIGRCRPVGSPYYESLKEAQEALTEFGIEAPQFGYNEKPA